MCQYALTNEDGLVGDWHMVHLGARAAGGFGLVIAEATGVVPEGRISPYCPGLWSDEHRDAWAPIVDFIHAQGAKAGIQLNHAGAKASGTPWLEDAADRFPGATRGTVSEAEGGWRTLAPSTGIGELLGTAEPRAMTERDIQDSLAGWGAAARRAVEAGFDVVQIHAAHGYLIHQFLSPLTNHREDQWGGSYEGRTRYLREVLAAVSAELPDSVELMIRISGTDWVDGGWTLEETVRLAGEVQEQGVSMFECSSAGIGPFRGPVGPAYQAPLAHAVKEAHPGLFVSAVGVLDDPKVADEQIVKGLDAVSIARAALRNPNWPVVAAVELGEDELPYSPHYWRAGFSPAH
jgi:2,4-dienoyl-CoA reductase-like NADH-dependent reductase (Old Yellow Enzyme family)